MTAPPFPAAPDHAGYDHEAADSLLLKDCRILDVVHQCVRPRQSILIENGRIARIGPAGAFTATARALPPRSVVDVGNRMVLPGLIDAHVHLNTVPADGEKDTISANLRATETLKVLYGARNAERTLHAGFTTVRDVGQGDNLALRDAIARGIVPGPRIVACGWVGMTGGHQQYMAPEHGFNLPVRSADRGADGIWELRQRVRRLIGRGVDAIKVYATGEGFRPHPWFPYWQERPNHTRAELEAVVDEAHAAGRKVAAHAMVNREGIKNAIAVGVDTLEHGLALDADDAADMAERGIIYVPTLAVIRKMWDVTATEEMRYLKIPLAEARRLIDSHRNSVAAARRAGVAIAAGSDTFRVLRHGDNRCELEALVAAGMSPMEALTAGTLTAARALGVDDMVGSLEEGKLADLLVVDPDPVIDIGNLGGPHSIALILQSGRRIQSIKPSSTI